MACHEVTGTICWDDPEPVVGLDSVYATPIVASATPPTYPYIAPTAFWSDETNAGNVSFVGWAKRGSLVQPSPGAENSRFTWRVLEMSRATVSQHYKVTFIFDTHENIEVTFNQNPSGPYRFIMPDDTLMSVELSYVSGSPTPAF